jgi:hypothetical protein
LQIETGAVIDKTVGIGISAIRTSLLISTITIFFNLLLTTIIEIRKRHF